MTGRLEIHDEERDRKIASFQDVRFPCFDVYVGWAVEARQGGEATAVATRPEKACIFLQG